MKQKRKWTNRNTAQMKVATLWEDSYLILAGKKAGKKCLEEKLGFHAFTDKQRSEHGKKMGKQNWENGVGLVARTAEKKTEDGKRGGTISGNKHKGKFFKKWAEENPELIFEQNSRIGKKQGKINVESGHLAKVRVNGGKNASEIQYTCEHCNKKVKGAVYHRWHGDNCNELQKIQTQIDIINMIKTKTFTSNDVAVVCSKLEYNYRLIKYGLLKNPTYIKTIKIGTNQNNPSIYQKIVKIR
jgi:hypothetical protein